MTKLYYSCLERLPKLFKIIVINNTVVGRGITLCFIVEDDLPRLDANPVGGRHDGAEKDANTNHDHTGVFHSVILLPHYEYAHQHVDKKPS